MLNILSDFFADKLWDKLSDEYGFKPGMNAEGDWIKVPNLCKTYNLGKVWDEEQESLVNSILEELVEGEMYALDYQHDCFCFSPLEHIPFEYEYYDSERDCNVYFPTFYPNGDYHMFVTTDWKYGIFGHPWRKEIVIMGAELINKFDQNENFYKRRAKAKNR